MTCHAWTSYADASTSGQGLPAWPSYEPQQVFMMHGSAAAAWLTIAAGQGGAGCLHPRASWRIPCKEKGHWSLPSCCHSRSKLASEELFSFIRTVHVSSLSHHTQYHKLLSPAFALLGMLPFTRQTSKRKGLWYPSMLVVFLSSSTTT